MKILPDKTVISPNAKIAPLNIVILGCFIAIMAAIKKVLSPNSETIITEKLAMKACMNVTSLTMDGLAEFMPSGSSFFIFEKKYFTMSGDNTVKIIIKISRIRPLSLINKAYRQDSYEMEDKIMKMLFIMSKQSF